MTKIFDELDKAYDEQLEKRVLVSFDKRHCMDTPMQAAMKKLVEYVEANLEPGACPLYLRQLFKF